MAETTVRLPSELEPEGREKIELPSGAWAAVGLTKPRFVKWAGASVANRLGGKPLVDTGDRGEFAEFAILRCFERGGWNGRWVETYGAKKDSDWPFPAAANSYIWYSPSGRRTSRSTETTIPGKTKRLRTRSLRVRRKKMPRASSGMYSLLKKRSPRQTSQ